MKVTKVTRKYYVVNGEKVYFFEPIRISKRAVQKLLNQSEKVVKSITCGMCCKYIQCKKDIRAKTLACKDFRPSKKQFWQVIQEMNKPYDEQKRPSRRAP